MRGKRAKKYKKVMHQYEVQFGFREPYQVLLDSQILQDTQNKMDVINRLQGVLGGEVKPMISQCDIRHLYSATPKREDVIDTAKTFERRRCGHHELPEPLTSLECITSCVDPKGSLSNKHRYVVATNKPEVRAAMRKIVGVPVVYVNKSVMILEPMADATEQARAKAERAKFKEGLKSARRPTGEKRKRDTEEEGTQAQGTASIEQSTTGDARPQKKKARGPKGPNPLSIRKAKKTEDGEPAKPKAPRAPKPDHPEQPAENAAGAADTEGGEAAKRKRKRKHKPKGDSGEAGGDDDGGVAIEADGQMDTT